MIWVRRWWHWFFCRRCDIYREYHDVWVCAGCGKYWGPETGEQF